MSLFSVEFIFCFLVFWLIYYIFKFSIFIQKLLILGFSYLFLFAINPIFLLINFVFTLIIYLFSRLILKFNFAFVLSIIFIILNLAFFKYKGYFGFEFKNEFLNTNIFPLGLSFYSFMAITYLYSVKIGELKPKFIDSFVFLSFFVTIVSGPILRAKEFFKTLNERKVFEYSNLIFTLILMAFFKKLILANHLFNYLTPIFNNINSYNFLELFSSLYLYSLLLYFDFSSYVDFVLALGLMCGFKPPKNFNRPFLATDLKEFWRRWHISLMSFFKDYIYIKLGGSRCGNLKTQRNILIVFMLSGIWHGGGLSFFIWGLLHGVCVVLLNLKKNFDILKFDILKRFITFSFLSFIWVFFIFKFDDSIGFIANLSELKEFEILHFLAFIFLIFVFLYLYEKINFYEILMFIFDSLNIFFIIIFLFISFLSIYFLMPSGMPEFIYQGF